ncbi:NAD-dependent succinate-semialdehyde dehydrogenase [Psychrosphaera aestuarii]|uniref:NAD-dependent succinate-semialdehyde dehydrogenase n=1 Tax=Psychrosphaera aestuarii TaxID=1266052 RepID=UPI001FD31471|nr:NAD-dependent succinate-semialdehyde dehydrogenase [Psychrosphaera aestuarii]
MSTTISAKMSELLKDPSLVKTGSLINGDWHSSDATFDVLNPYDQEVLVSVSEVAKDDMSQVEKAIASAKRAQQEWQQKTAYERYDLMMAWFDLMIQHKEDLAIIMTLEQGKPLKESRGEIEYGASYVKWFAEESKRIYGDTIPALASNQTIKVIKEPVGVVAAITPWNFPNSMLARKIAPAIAAGNSIVARPTELTPLSALVLGELANRAGIPKGVINILVGSNAKEVGKVLTTHEDVDKFSFTGSTNVGKLLMEQCASTVKKVSFELGGNAPFIVFEDADIDAAVDGAIKAKFRNAGQTCVCVNRIMVHSSVHDEFVEKFVEKVKLLDVGNGLDNVDIGPLIHPKAADDVRELVREATEQGATIKYGQLLSGTIQSPIVITDVNNEMQIAKTEIFGPVAAIQRFETEKQAVLLANDTPFGLASYFYSQNASRIERVSRGLKYGIVGVNEGLISNAAAPFGGVKQSGFGREGSLYGLDDYLNMKYICTTYEMS